MSLLNEQMETCTLIEIRRVKDGYGGYDEAYYDGIDFKAAIVLDSSLQAEIAKKEGVTGLYTITTDKALTLRFHDLLRRESDGKVFRVTSNGDDKKTPDSATLNMRQVRAEEWSL